MGHERTVTLYFVANDLIAGTGSGEIPMTVIPESLNSTFSVSKLVPNVLKALGAARKLKYDIPVSASRKPQTSLVQPKVPEQHSKYD
jgi:hypothetical protein